MKRSLLIIVVILFSVVVYSQAPGIFNYQGVARNSVGNVLVNKTINLRLTIHDGSAAGPVVYQESRTAVTNPFGLFNVQVGSPGGSNVTGTIAGVPWNVGGKFLQVEIDPAGGTSFINIGTAQIASVPYAWYSALSGDLTLPFLKTQADAGTLFRINNSGAGISGAIMGTTRSGAGNAWGVHGQVDNTSAGGFSSGILGTNLSTTGLGIGVTGTQAGSGWGVYGTTPSGIGVYGASTSGFGVYGQSTTGISVYGLQGSSGTSNAGRFDNTNAANTNPALMATTNGTASNVFAVQGEVTATTPGGFSAGVRGINRGTGGLGIGVYGSHDGSGWGVYGTTIGGIGVNGFATTGIGIFGNSNSGTGGRFTTTSGIALHTTGGLRLQGINEAVNRVLTTDAAGNATWQDPAPATSLVLPFVAVENNPATLFSITNNGDGTSIEGVNNTTTSSIAAVRGIVSSTTPGGFSSALRGINNGTGGLGIGIWGSQAGSGWGVYGVTPNGLGVYGNSSGNGYGVYANSNSGTGLQATSNSGIAASLSIFNNANNNNVLDANTTGNGTVINVLTTGTGKGLFASTGSGFSVHGITNAISSAAIVGNNTGGGESIVGFGNSDIAGAVVGRQDGGGFGVRGFIATNDDGTAIGVLGQVGLNNSTGRAGRFENFNQSNEDGNTFEVETNSNGNIPDNTQGNAGSFLVDNTNSVSAGVRSEVKTIFGNFGAAGIFGVSSGTGGFAGLFHASNASGNGASLVSISDGNGNAITANSRTGNGVEANVDESGTAVYGWVPSFSDDGRAARFNHYSEDNDNPVVTVRTLGNGEAVDAMVDNTLGTSAALKGEVNSIFSNFGTAGVYGISSGTGGFAALFHSSNPAGNGPAVIALSDGNGNGVTANSQNGDGVEATVDGSGTAVFGWTPNFSPGRAARFVNFNTANVLPVLTVEQRSTGDIALFRSNTPVATVARLDGTGRMFANGGFQASGADVAEYFEVTGNRKEYEEGDVLIISSDKDRTVEKSSTPYSTLVAGVYATKPGLLLSEAHIDQDLSGQVPMGVIGVIPTKVCLEGGPIKRGDLIVTSSVPGVAMKADPDKVKVGQVMGKSLQDFDGTGIGKINVLVSIK